MRDALAQRDVAHSRELASVRATLTSQGEGARAAAQDAAATELREARSQWESELAAAKSRHAQVGHMVL